jgi:hypothetical protein
VLRFAPTHRSSDACLKCLHWPVFFFTSLRPDWHFPSDLLSCFFLKCTCHRTDHISQVFSRTAEPGLRLEPSSPRWPLSQFSVHAKPHPTLSGTGRLIERQAAPKGGQYIPVYSVSAGFPTTHLQRDWPRTLRNSVSLCSRGLQLSACVQLTHRSLFATSNLPAGEARRRPVHRIIFIFTPQYGCAVKDKWEISLAAGFRNAVASRMEAVTWKFSSENGVYIVFTTKRTLSLVGP